MGRLYLGLGSNLGERKANLNLAVRHIGKRIGRICSLSSFYETSPWGYTSPNAFLNAVVCVETNLTAMQVLNMTQRIERGMGRAKKSKRGEQYQDRSIDIDILFYDDLVLHSDNLDIPHPLIQERHFVLAPLVEIAPDFVHPVLGQTICQLYNDFITKP